MLIIGFLYLLSLVQNSTYFAIALPMIGNTGAIVTPLDDNYLYETNYITSYYVQKPDRPIDPNLSTFLQGFLNDSVTTYFNGIFKSAIELGLSANLIIHENTSSSRVKRFLDHGALPFIGWIQQKIGGVALTSDLDDLKVQSTDLTQHVSEIKKILLSQGHTIEKLIHDTEMVKVSIDQVNKDMTHLYTNILKEEKAINELENSIKQILKVIKLSMILRININHYQQLINTFNVGYSICLNGMIPFELIDPNLLKSSLNQIRSSVKQLGYQFSIPLSKLSWYYQHKLSYCKLDESGLLIGIAIPIKSSQFDIVDFFQITYVPIRINNLTYRINEERNQVGYQIQDNHFLLQKFSSLCPDNDANTLRDCLIKPEQVISIPKHTCLTAILKNSKIEDYKKYCNLIEDKTQSQWIKINSTSWIYTGAQISLTIRCPNGRINMVLGGHDKNTVINLGCNCYPDQNEWIFLSSSQVCYNRDTSTIKHLMSNFYLPYDSLISSNQDMFTPFEFERDNLPENITLNISKYSEDVKRIEKQADFLNSQTPRIQWTSGFHSYWYYFTWVALIIVSVIICYLFWRNRQSKLGQFALLSSLQTPVNALDLETNLELTFEFIIFVVLVVFLFLIYRSLKSLLRKFSCHHYEVNQFYHQSGPHIDLVVPYYGTPICIGLKNLSSPIYTYYTFNLHGKVTSDGEMLHLSEFPPITGLVSTAIDVNGIYGFTKLKPFAQVDGVLKASN